MNIKIDIKCKIEKNVFGIGATGLFYNTRELPRFSASCSSFWNVKRSPTIILNTYSLAFLVLSFKDTLTQYFSRFKQSDM
jgi:hypothetical protein